MTWQRTTDAKTESHAAWAQKQGYCLCKAQDIGSDAESQTPEGTWSLAVGLGAGLGTEMLSQRHSQRYPKVGPEPWLQVQRESLVRQTDIIINTWHRDGEEISDPGIPESLEQQQATDTTMTHILKMELGNHGARSSLQQTMILAVSTLP